MVVYGGMVLFDTQALLSLHTRPKCHGLSPVHAGRRAAGG